MNRLRLAGPVGRVVPMGIFVVMGGVVLSGCNAPPPPSGQAQADAKTRAACQARAEQAYVAQNRGQIFAPQSQVNTPYSANYTSDLEGRGLSDLFAHDRMVSDCIRNTGTNSDRGVPAGR